MPSGSRKRKAAKKKKELEANNNNNTHDQDDAKSQDDKGSDGGEVSSPAHQDHRNSEHHPSNDGDPSGVRSIASENIKSDSQDGDVIEIQWSLKPEDESSTSTGSSSRSSSDDDESRAAEKKRDEEEEDPPTQVVAENGVSGPGGNLVAELSPVIGSAMPVAVPVSEETLELLDTAPIDNLLVHEVIQSDAVVLETVPGSSLEKCGDKTVLSSDEDSKASPSELKSGLKGSGDSKTLASSENQIPISPVANPVQKTSAFNCCGIFDLFFGSNR